MSKAAIVTGAATGIGLAVAERLLDDGFAVALVDADAEALAEAEEILTGEEVLFLLADVSDEEEVGEAFDQAVDALGPLHALVNCAGLRREVLFEHTSAELFRQLLEVNLVGTLIASQAALDRMGDELAIVNLSSASGLRANAGHAAYGASKAGVKLLSESMAVELASRGVRVNCIAPGPGEGASPQLSAAWRDTSPQRRLIQPREVANAVAWLLSAEASGVTGHTIAIDGGFAIAGMARTD